MGVQHRLTPEMSSRKLQVLDFIKRYYAAWGSSPSYGEIAAGLTISRTRAKAIVNRLASEGQINREPGGRRGITLPVPAHPLTEADALLLLRREGWTVDADAQRLDLSASPCTNPTLPPVFDLDHIPDVEVGEFPDGRIIGHG